MKEICLITIAALAVGATFGFALYYHSKATSVRTLANDLQAQFVDVDAADQKLVDVKKEYTSLQRQYSASKKELDESKTIVNQHELGVGTLDEKLVKTTHSIVDIEKLEAQLLKIKDRSKDMVRNKGACICIMGDDFVVNGKRAGAKKLFNREIKLRLRCFDNEVKAAVASADWNNIDRLNERVKKTFSDINKSGDLVKTFITTDYLTIKLRELNLTFEIAQLKSIKNEEEREARRLEREAQREDAKIKAAAEIAQKERARMEKLVEQELAKLDRLTDKQRDELKAHQQELEELRGREQRALSMAQQTRAGFVYVISNANSFSDRMVKVGMTRRTEPNQRIRELGDASVPDTFDVHAFFYCEDAPRLESDIHNQLEQQRVNLVNRRKEFFNVEPEHVIDLIQGHELDTTLIAEA